MVFRFFLVGVCGPTEADSGGIHSTFSLGSSWEEQALQTPGEATAPAESNGAAMASTATSADSAGMQAEEQQKEPEPTSPEHAEQEENEELEEAWFD